MSFLQSALGVLALMGLAWLASEQRRAIHWRPVWSGIVLALVKSPIEKIDSVGVTVLSKSEDIANARIQFKNGCVANLSASRMSTKKAREIRIFQGDAYLSLDFMNQAGHLVKKSDIIAYGLKMKIGLVKAGDLSATGFDAAMPKGTSPHHPNGSGWWMGLGQREPNQA
jgi:hypothetical protein